MQNKETYKGLYEASERAVQRLREQLFAERVHHQNMKNRIDVLEKRRGDLLGLEETVNRLNAKLAKSGIGKLESEIDRLNLMLKHAEAANEVMREDARKFREAVKFELFKESALCRDRHFAEDDEHLDAFEAVQDAASKIEELRDELNEVNELNEHLRDKLAHARNQRDCG